MPVIQIPGRQVAAYSGDCRVRWRVLNSAQCVLHPSLFFFFFFFPLCLSPLSKVYQLLFLSIFLFFYHCLPFPTAIHLKKKLSATHLRLLTIATCWVGRVHEYEKLEHREENAPVQKKKYLMHRGRSDAVVMRRRITSSRRRRCGSRKGGIKHTRQRTITILVMIIVAHDRGRRTCLITFHHSVRHTFLSFLYAHIHTHTHKSNSN